MKMIGFVVVIATFIHYADVIVMYVYKKINNLFRKRGGGVEDTSYAQKLSYADLKILNACRKELELPEIPFSPEIRNGEYIISEFQAHTKKFAKQLDEVVNEGSLKKKIVSLETKEVKKRWNELFEEQLSIGDPYFRKKEFDLLTEELEYRKNEWVEKNCLNFIMSDDDKMLVALFNKCHKELLDRGELRPLMRKVKNAVISELIRRIFRDVEVKRRMEGKSYVSFTYERELMLLRAKDALTIDAINAVRVKEYGLEPIEIN